MKKPDESNTATNLKKYVLRGQKPTIYYEKILSNIKKSLYVWTMSTKLAFYHLIQVWKLCRCYKNVTLKTLQIFTLECTLQCNFLW